MREVIETPQKSSKLTGALAGTTRYITRAGSKKTLGSSLATAAVATLLATSTAHAVGYTAYNLGDVYATGINKTGQISVGAWKTRASRITPLPGATNPWYVDANNDGRNDLLVDMPLPKGYKTSSAAGINNSGQIGGRAYVPLGAASAALFTPSGSLALESKRDSEAFGINDAGDLIGRIYLSGYGPHLWKRQSNGSYSSINLLNATPFTQGVAWAVNNNTQATGAVWTDGSYQQAFSWSSGRGLVTVGRIFNPYNDPSRDITGSDDNQWDRSNHGHDINDGGQLVLYSQTGRKDTRRVYQRGLIWDTISDPIGDTLKAGQATEIVYLPPADNPNIGSYIYPIAINNVGQVAGRVQFYDDITKTTTTNFAFMWQGGIIVNLNDVASLGAGYTLTSARDINDAGQILCEWRNADGATGRCVLVPVA